MLYDNQIKKNIKCSKTTKKKTYIKSTKNKSENMHWLSRLNVYR